MNLKEINITDFDFLKQPKEKITFLKKMLNNKNVIYLICITLLTALMLNHIIHVVPFIMATSYLTSFLFFLFSLDKLKYSKFDWIAILNSFIFGVLPSLINSA